MHSSWEGLNISVSFHLRYFCRFPIRALNKQRRYCLQTIPFEFYLDSTACWERGFEAFTKALWLPRQYRSIKLVDTHLIIPTLTQEAPIYPGHQRIPLSRSVWRWEGAPTHPPCLVFKICTEFPIYHGVVSVNYTGDEKPERVKAASILPFWYLPEYSCRGFFLVPTAVQACNDESFFFFCSGSSDFSSYESLWLWCDVSRTALLLWLGQWTWAKECLAVAEYRQHLQVIRVLPVSFQHLKMLAGRAFMEGVTGQCSKDSCNVVSTSSDERKSGSRIRDFV